LTLKQRVDEHDREIAAIRKLLLQGAKMLVKIQEAQKRLEASQEKTDALLQTFLKSMQRGNENGHSKRKIP